MAFIQLEKSNHIAVIKFDRPEALNAINSQFITELDIAIEDVNKDDSVKVIIFTGEGKAFISGADIKEMEHLRGLDIRNFTIKGRDLFRRIELMEKPTIAAINGFAFGGGLELALCTDIRIAGENVKMGLPEAGLGIVPGFTGTQRLPRIIGKAKAKELMFTGRPLNAQEACDLGLVNKVTPKEELMEEAMAMANAILKNSMTAVAFIKKAVDQGLELPMDAAIELETGFVGYCFGSKDQIEGFAAFQEKRKPDFSKKEEI